MSDQYQTHQRKGPFWDVVAGPLTGEAWVVQKGKHIAFVEGRLNDPAGDAVARATATFRLFGGA